MAQSVNRPIAILDERWLWRRIPRWPNMLVLDNSSARWRPSSLNFKGTGAYELSTNIGHLTSKEEMLKEHPDAGIARFLAGVAREQGQAVKHDPQVDCYAHALVVGEKTKTVAKILAKKCEWVHSIEPPP